MAHGEPALPFIFSRNNPGKKNQNTTFTSPASIFVHFRYLFNCGEGTQRLAHEHRTKLTRMEHIFLTRNTWNRFGGVPGLCLTLQEIGVPKLNLHGPPGIESIFESTRKFVVSFHQILKSTSNYEMCLHSQVLRNMKVETPVCEEEGFFEDSVLRVNYVPLYKNNVKPTTAAPEAAAEEDDGFDNETQKEEAKKSPIKPDEFDDNTDYFGYESKNSRGNFNKESKEAKKTEAQDCNDRVMAFICKLRERAGTLDFGKCVEKGVKPGPLLGRLKNGFDITLPDGTLVKADDVRGPASPGSVFVFVDIPDESYLEALTSSKAFLPYQKGAGRDEDVALIVVHFSPEAMMENASYKLWMNEFSPSTKHWFVNERNEFSGYFASHRIQRQLNELNTQVFPLLKERHPYLPEVSEFSVDPEDESPAKKFKIDVTASDKFSEYQELGILSTFHIRPAKGFDRYMEPYSNPEKVAEKTVADPEVKMLINSFKEESKKFTAPRSNATRAKEYPKIITFGTGSCIPNKTRNVSANLVHFSEDNCAILDCGEGTLGQLVRFYGRKGADEVLKNTRLIYVSHLHADHHLGLINILNRRRKVTNEKVLLLAPIQIRAWLAFYNRSVDEIYSTFDLFSCSDLVRKLKLKLHVSAWLIWLFFSPSNSWDGMSKSTSRRICSSVLTWWKSKHATSNTVLIRLASQSSHRPRRRKDFSPAKRSKWRTAAIHFPVRNSLKSVETPTSWFTKQLWRTIWRRRQPLKCTQQCRKQSTWDVKWMPSLWFWRISLSATQRFRSSDSTSRTSQSDSTTWKWRSTTCPWCIWCTSPWRWFLAITSSWWSRKHWSESISKSDESKSTSRMATSATKSRSLQARMKIKSKSVMLEATLFMSQIKI